ncbi:MAG: hypothetical protein ACKVZH_13380 [Blastocatellia bacterium]
MRTSRCFTSILTTLAILTMMAVSSFAADPGIPFPTDGVAGDQKAGSVLIYSVYTSSATSPATENARINITNTSDTRDVAIHLFFIDGASCSPADSVMCLTRRQTVSFRASEFDPGTMGYLVVVAIDNNGCPIAQNTLIGDEYVKFSSGHEANLQAVAAAAKTVPVCDATTTDVVMNFDGIQYDQLPQTVAIDNITSRVDGNDTMLILIRPSGNMGIGADAIGSIAGIMYNDAENAYSFTFSSGQCQTKFSINNSTPRTAPRFTTVVPSGRTGWMKMFNYSGAPLLGAVINFNPAASASPTAFNQGHNLHILRLAASSTMRVPVFPPNC